MPSWKTVCKWTAIIFLLFLGIPIKIGPGSPEVKEKFDHYIKHFNKTYKPESEEYLKRYEAFKDTLARIDRYNYDRTSNHTALYGLTKFSDLTQSEFYAHLDEVKRLSKSHQRKVEKNAGENFTIVLELTNPLYTDGFSSIKKLKMELETAGLPFKMDWRKRGVIGEVADQGLCGACWAYSTVQVAEAMAAMKTGNLTKMSVQQMIDCATNGNFGCKGGDICSLLVWLTKYNVSIHQDREYPTTKKSATCHNVKSLANGVQIKDFTCGPQLGKEANIVKWVATVGPVAVAVNALSWQNYLGGVIQHHCTNDITSLNHAVQIIGYDLTVEIPYFIAKNSWGKTFGLDGYLYLAIGGNICGLANEVSMLRVL